MAAGKFLHNNGVQFIKNKNEDAWDLVQNTNRRGSAFEVDIERELSV